MNARIGLVSTTLLVTGMLTVSVAADSQPAKDEKAPATKSAPKQSAAKEPAAEATSHCEGPWIDRGNGKEPCPPAAAKPDAGNKVNTLEDIYVPPKETS